MLTLDEVRVEKGKGCFVGLWVVLSLPGKDMS